MKQKTVQIDKLLGIRNDIDAERLAVGDLVSASNVDLDETGKPSRRLGYTRRVACTPKAMFGAGSFGYFMDGTDLKRFTPPSTTTTLRSGLSSTKRMAYVELNGRVFYTNTEITGKVVDGISRSWGLTVPTLPVPTAGVGDLREGWYGYTMTYVRSDGQESGAARMQVIKLSNNQGVSLAGLPVSSDTEVVRKNMYFTARNGEVPFLVGSIVNAATVFAYRQDLAGSVPIATMFRGPPPTGHLLETFNGRILVAQGSYLWYTEPYAPELVDYRSGYIPIGGDITVIAPVDDGVFVSTQDRTLFLAGDEPEKFSFTEKAPYGAPLGNAVDVDAARILEDGAGLTSKGWMSKTGFCIGSNGGQVTNLTQTRYTLPEAKRTATVFKQRGGLTQFISTLYT